MSEFVRRCPKVTPVSLGPEYIGTAHEEALTHLSRTVLEYPDFAQIHQVYGKSLAATGRHAEALAAFQRAIDLDPKNGLLQRDVLQLLMSTKGPTEARTVWGRSLQLKPASHDAWYGYAEYCLYLGDRAEYFRARRDLLEMFGSTTDPLIAERTGRACLLLPLEGEELRQAIALIELAAGVEAAKNPAYYSYFQFAHGLAKYRQGQFDKAITVMRGEASKVLGPAPKFVLAMSMHRTGHVNEARAILAEAIRSHHWKPVEGHYVTGWVYHVLRREAEELVSSTGEK